MRKSPSVVPPEENNELLEACVVAWRRSAAMQAAAEVAGPRSTCSCSRLLTGFPPPPPPFARTPQLPRRQRESFAKTPPLGSVSVGPFYVSRKGKERRRYRRGKRRLRKLCSCRVRETVSLVNIGESGSTFKIVLW